LVRRLGEKTHDAGTGTRKKERAEGLHRPGKGGSKGSVQATSLAGLSGPGKTDGGVSVGRISRGKKNKG